MKKICYVFVMLGIATQTQAQVSLSLTGGSGFSSIPERSGNVNASFLASYEVWPNIDLGLAVGYQYFQPERFNNQYTIVIPFTIEGRYKLSSEGVRPYAQIELGVAQIDWKYVEHTLYPSDFFEFMPDRAFTRRNKDWYPMISMGVGALVPLTNQFSLDLGLRLGALNGGAATDQTLIYGRVPDTISSWQENADTWSYFRVVIGVRAEF